MSVLKGALWSDREVDRSGRGHSIPIPTVIEAVPALDIINDKQDFMPAANQFKFPEPLWTGHPVATFALYSFNKHCCWMI